MEAEPLPLQDKVILYGVPSDVSFESLYLRYEKEFGEVKEEVSVLKEGIALLTFTNAKGKLILCKCIDGLRGCLFYLDVHVVY